LPAQTCYVIISPRKPAVRAVPRHSVATPWYERLWSSVHEADKDKVAPK
jgi:hypothetical protein